jgi:hypothetical protein
VSESTPSLPRNNKQNWLILLGLTAIAGLSVGIYILASVEHLRLGFPLDDAWIHQTYARNFARYGEWAFIPGQPSAGSTSPLWTLILAAGYLLKLSPFIWAFSLGCLLLGTLAIQLERGLRLLLPEIRYKLPYAGILIIFEFHFVWSAVSGMETLLHAVIILTISLALLRENPRWFLLGTMTGVSTWIRPDGFTLLVPILLTGILIAKGWKAKIQSILWVTIGFAIFFGPYLYFNYSLSGNIFPTTFYAKQAEYVSWQAGSVLNRSLDFLLTFLTGPAVVLLPAFLIETRNAIKNRSWPQLFLILWMVGYGGMYMLRLPAYQHGRYLIPAMPDYFLFSMMGLFRFLKSGHSYITSLKLIKRAWVTTLFLLCAGFWILGMRAYVSDVEFIETEMVDTAKWVSENLPGNAVLAAHDIGALGYFDDHQLVDLAGLISPDIIHFILDEEHLAEYLDLKKATHLVVFPDWYPSLTEGLTPVFSTGATYAPSVGGTNLTVYQWR